MDWSGLLVSADHGPDSWCAQARLESPCHSRLNMVREPDEHNHGVHNDTLGAVMDSGFGSFLFSATVAFNIHFGQGMMVRSAARSSKPLTPSGSSVRPHILCSNIWQKSLVTRGACLDHGSHQTASNTSSKVVFWHPSLSPRVGRKLACAGGSKCSCLCEGFLMTGQACLWSSSARIWMSHGCPQVLFTGKL